MLLIPAYLTPRAFLIECLNNESADCANWIEKNKTYHMDQIQTFVEWYRSCMKSCQLEENNENMIDYAKAFFMSLRASTGFERWFDETEGLERMECTIVMKSTEVRGSVNDLKKAKLYQWIIQMLCEETRVDWIGFSDKDRLEFEILDMEGMGDMYTKVNGIKATNGVYYMKMMLSSYCMNGIIKKTGTNKYQFDRDWYLKEVNSIKEMPTYEDEKAEYLESLVNFPSLTLEHGNKDYPFLL